MSSKAVIPFLVGMMLLTGVCNTLLTKYQDMQCVAHCDRTPAQQRTFEQPVLQTLQMFIGESGCWLVVLAFTLLERYGKSASPDAARDTVYAPLMTSDPNDDEEGAALPSQQEEEEDDQEAGIVDPTNLPARPLASTSHLPPQRLPLTGTKIFLLALPACCDIAGTTLMNVGLLFVAASIYQMTRGALVLFVGLFSVIFLHHRLGAWKWTSLFIVVAGVALVGLAGYLERRGAAVGAEGKAEVGLAGGVFLLAKEHTALETLFGVLLIAGAQVFTASQFVIEESIMRRYAMEPLQVVGWEGVFGFSVTVIGMVVLHLAVGRTPAGQGGYFDAKEGLSQVFSHPAIAWSSLAIMFSIGGFNFFGLSVTRSISATARSTIDTCRTLFIWLVSLGLGWETFKWLQVPGFALLVYGTALFNEIIRPTAVRYLRRRMAD